jgi:hypothetical protein
LEKKQSLKIHALSPDYPRPWWIGAQVWGSDAPLFEQWMIRGEFSGTLFLVPHEVGNVQEEQARSAFARVLQSPNVHWIGKKGVLMNLYAQCDAAYVGGGFGQGVHNTMEPAVFGIPISCGPARVETFTEISQLKTSQQLKVIQNAQEFIQWANEFEAGRKFQSQIPELGAATQKHLELLRSSAILGS